MTFDIYPASAMPDDALHAGMMECFSDYLVPLSMTPTAFSMMMHQRGLDRAASQVAVARGELIGIWFVGLRDAAAYLIASGTVPTHRGQGIASILSANSLAGLRAWGTETFQTEVLAENHSATRIYARLGMQERRRLSCFATQLGAASPPVTPVERVAWFQVASVLLAWRDWLPSWQNDDASMTAAGSRVMGLRILEDGVSVAAAAFLCDSGTLAQIAVRPDRRRQGLGAALVRATCDLVPNGRVRILNAQEDDAGFAAFAAAQGFEETVVQRELLMKL